MDTRSANARAPVDHVSRSGDQPGAEDRGTSARAEARGSECGDSEPRRSEREVFETGGSVTNGSKAHGVKQGFAACSHPRRREDLIAEVIDGDLLLFDPVTANTHHLNETAHAIWRMCDGTRTVADMADALCGPFDVERDAALRSAGDLLQKLAAQGLLVEVGTPRGG